MATIMKAWKSAVGAISMLALANPALAGCATARDAAALRTASLQQRLMVAGLACHADADYNRFVLANRPELQRSDADLKDYFVQGEGGEAGYDAYKTRLANLAAAGPAMDRGAFCATAQATFAALAAPGGLARIVAQEPLTGESACEVTAKTNRAPEQVAALEALPAASAPLPPAMPSGDAPARLPRMADVSASGTDILPQPPAPARSEGYWYYRRVYARLYGHSAGP